MSLLLPLFVSFILTLILVPAFISLAKKAGLVDDPKKRKHPAAIHKKVIPRGGGLPIFVAVAASILLFLGSGQRFLGIILGGLILVSIGILDDRKALGSGIRLLAQLLAALAAVGAGVGIAFITNPLAVTNIFGNFDSVIRLDTVRWTFEFFGQRSILVFADIFAIFWIVWVINMVNFSAGVDGQMPGIVLVALFVIFFASARFIPQDPSQIEVAKLSLIGVGATAGFLVFNFYPAKIFPGDSGSYFLGFLVAVCAILSGAKVGTAILVMAVPLIDGVFTVIRRAASGKSPFLGDRKHLQHRLLDMGWGQRRIALFYWLLCAILGSVALLLHSVEKVFAGLLIAIIILGGILWINMNLSQKLQK